MWICKDKEHQPFSPYITLSFFSLFANLPIYSLPFPSLRSLSLPTLPSIFLLLLSLPISFPTYLLPYLSPSLPYPSLLFPFPHPSISSTITLPLFIYFFSFPTYPLPSLTPPYFSLFPILQFLPLLPYPFLFTFSFHFPPPFHPFVSPFCPFLFPFPSLFPSLPRAFFLLFPTSGSLIFFVIVFL